jgi:DNA topoisomerase-1
MPGLRVGDLTTKRTTTRPSAPFTTASLQQAASTRLGFAASRTMRVAQSLYEGLDLHGEGPVGLITYMRTDSTNLSGEAIKSVRGFIRQTLGDKYLPEKPNFYGKRQARAQEAHEAIRPTDPNRTPESLKGHLTGEQSRLYDLIWKRFVACQMPAAQWDSTSVSVACDTALGEASLSGNGRKLVFDGFMRIAGVTSEDQILPDMQVGQPVGMLDLDPKQQFTSPPARYTEASLVKALETEGIGRPSTYASIIDTVQTRGYVEQEDRKFFPTSLGELVTDKLIDHFPKIMDVKFTSYMEDELDKIEDAHLDWVHVLHEFYDPFKDLLELAGEAMEAVRSQPSEHACRECGQPMVYRWSKTGRFLACSGYPKCKVTFNVNRHGEPIVPKQTDHACELCGKPMVLRHSKTGHFLGCGGYPECRNTIASDEHGEPLTLVKEEDLKRPCDVCGEGTMTVKRKGRKAFLGCDQYPKCKNTAQMPSDVRLESKPLPPPEEAGVACEKCARPMVIRSGKRGKFIACSGFPKCRNTRPIEKLEELQKSSPAKATAEEGAVGANGVDPAGADAAKSGAAGKSSKRTAGKNGKISVADLGEPPAGFAWTRTGRPVVETMPAEDEDLHCPDCGEPMLLKRGRFGPFFSCTGFPKCKFVSNLRGDAKKKAEELMPAPDKPKPEPSGVDCEECGKEMLIREGRRGKFLGCSGYPKCTATRELPAGVGA